MATTQDLDSKTIAHSGAGGHGHGEAVGPDRFLAHHFEDHAQQFDAGKLGMWLFLVQEILFFSGLFCAYAIYRSNHPDIFVYADHFLDRRLGAINTCVLIFSSFTMAWAIRAAQLNQRRLSAALLAITLACAGAFLGIKYVEYQHKWKDGLLWGRRFAPQHEAGSANEKAGESVSKQVTGQAGVSDKGQPAEPGLADRMTHKSGPVSEEMGLTHRPNNVHIFFGIYFAMTGLHALHIIIGMGIIAWMIQRTLRGDFSDAYFAPIEYTGLYWHLVDLVWIYLFPLLYLIH